MVIILLIQPVVEEISLEIEIIKTIGIPTEYVSVLYNFSIILYKSEIFRFINKKISQAPKNKFKELFSNKFFNLLKLFSDKTSETIGFII